MADRRRTKPRPKAEASTKLRSALTEGDIIEYGMTAHINHPTHGEWWLRAGGATSIREGEDAMQARERLKDFVVDTIDQSAKEILRKPT